MEITLRDVDNVFNPNARGGMPQSHTIAQVQVNCQSQDELNQLLEAMRRWANNTFEDVVIEVPKYPEESITIKKTPEVKVDVDLLTGRPI